MTIRTGSTTTASLRAARGLRLRGVTWLIWRQHRATFWTMIAATAAGVAWIAFQRARMMEYLDLYSWPHPKSDDWIQGFTPHIQSLHQSGYAVALVPGLLGVFVGAPLLAGDLENGTVKLVTSQSVSRVRWLSAKLGITLCVVVVCTMVLSLAFGWWCGPVKATPVLSWADDPVIDSTGPMPTSLTLFTVVAGVAIGMLLRRVLMAMVVTFGLAVVVQFLWGYFRLSLGTVATVTTHDGVAAPTLRLPPGAYLTDQSFLTSSGRTIGWSTCTSEPPGKAHAACLAKDHVVGWSVEYLPLSRMFTVQWSGAAVLLAMACAVMAFVLLRSRQRLV
ncbi:ABC transporter permease subunit [Streptomyces silvisoli]|uniref:ABC transporter permease subunit n=1 Tax=Streptomyces silvisoli TaxID=3034235 RepID=A0ABT5ZSD5_9ACTN|nr:ABC transporter permease subunit [Streptomyces silvisoli]MDF3292646.1 ABC transporter permease subunit [Streptomyces silvisoli]